eukprot:7717902-Prorocentrum_lima.AAC.1
MDAQGLGRRGQVPDRRFGLQCFFPPLQPGDIARSGMAGHGPSAVGDDSADARHRSARPLPQKAAPQ